MMWPQNSNISMSVTDRNELLDTFLEILLSHINSFPTYCLRYYWADDSIKRSKQARWTDRFVYNRKKFDAIKLKEFELIYFDLMA